ncbi:hypothetical protein LXA43DRAFT_757747 [Ganoderma leucocontextum]|nr:hypothetical protein LXA43DRAFT_757747 [Ganoderma leucocontextum]
MANMEHGIGPPTLSGTPSSLRQMETSLTYSLRYFIKPQYICRVTASGQYVRPEHVVMIARMQFTLLREKLVRFHGERYAQLDSDKSVVRVWHRPDPVQVFCSPQVPRQLYIWSPPRGVVVAVLPLFLTRVPRLIPPHSSFLPIIWSPCTPFAHHRLIRGSSSDFVPPSPTARTRSAL